jgi:sucrose-6-phosphate hydrolase SacC (GH32 family)
MFKMGNRWYLLASLYGRTSNGVGRPTYWIGDEGKKITENNWQSKSENSLDGDDLCAAQVVSDGAKSYIWGWIEKKWQGGDWGGHINLAHEVYALSDGSLATRLDETVGQKIRGRELAKITETTLQSGSTTALEGVFSRVDLAATVQLNSSAASFALGDVKVQINAKNNVISVTKDENDPMQYFATYRVPEGSLNGDVNVRIIAEDDMIEVFVNDRYSLCARINENMQNKSIQVIASDGSVTVKNAVAYKLKFLEEIQ